MRDLNKVEEDILNKILDVSFLKRHLFVDSTVYKNESYNYKIKKELISYEFLNKVLTDITDNGYVLVPF